MTTDRDPPANFDPSDDSLPPALAEAVRQARAMQPTPDSSAGLVDRLSRLGSPQTVAVAPRRSRAWRISAGVAALAASLLLALALWGRFRPAPQSPDLQVAQGESFPQYSPVTKVSLVDAGFKQIEADFQEAEARLTQTADDIALAELRRDVRTTLEEYPRWGR